LDKRTWRITRDRERDTSSCVQYVNDNYRANNRRKTYSTILSGTVAGKKRHFTVEIKRHLSVNFGSWTASRTPKIAIVVWKRADRFRRHFRTSHRPRDGNYSIGYILPFVDFSGRRARKRYTRRFDRPMIIFNCRARASCRFRDVRLRRTIIIFRSTTTVTKTNLLSVTPYV